jgi:alkylation response protein AidB-like acyl-CoA dehydrogenase
MTVGLTFERSLPQGGDSRRLLRAMQRWALTSVDDEGRPRSEDPGVLARLGRAAAEIEVSTLLARRCAWVQSTGTLPGVEGSMAKLFATEALTRQAAEFMDMLGPDGIRADGDATAVADGIAEYSYRYALGTTTYGGTSEIQRNIIAQRGLGLPRPS